MKIISVNVGLPRMVEYRGEPVVTGIFKQSVAGRVRVDHLNLDGDAQADLRVHGGPYKAVYAYPSEHYVFWRSEFPDMDLPYGMFGENLTTDGLLEDEIFIGDRLRIGTAEFAVTQPRLPCYKLGLRFGRSDIIRRFLVSMRCGIYFTVLKTGEIGTGDEIEILERDENAVTVTDILRLYVKDKKNTELMKRAMRIEMLPDSWKQDFAALIG